MVSRTRTGTSCTCGARTLLGEAYRAIPLGGRLGSHSPALNPPRGKAADHHLRKVSLNDGLGDDRHASQPFTNLGFPCL